jgi:ABC-2 type transport system permease protein
MASPTVAHPGVGGVRPKTTLAWLLYPRQRATRHRVSELWESGRLQLLGLIALATLFWGAVFYLFHRSLGYFLAFPEFGNVLTYKLLSMVFVVFFSVLVFSNVVTALSTFYLSEDLDRVVAAPVAPHLFFYSRFTENVFESSWMILMFALPAFIAYGAAHGAGFGFYALAALTLPAFVVVPAAVGVAVTSVLVNVFPARRTRDLLILLAIVAFAFVYLALRLLQPERLLHPEASASVVQFLSELRTPSSIWLPTTWATQVLHGSLTGNLRTPLFYLFALWSTAAALLVLCETLTTHLFLSGWSKAQEGKKIRLTRQPGWERLVALATAPLPAQMRLLVVKELRMFFRDTSQWSQLVLLLALVVVYVYNFRVVPLGEGLLVTFYFRNVIGFFNLALAAFVIAAIAVRFVFPSISLEGKYFWITRAGPVRPSRLWWSKFLVGFLPLAVLGQVLAVATNYYLDVIPMMSWLASVTLLAITPGIVALGLAVGAIYPKFGATNAARVASGTGGLIYMIASMMFIGAVVSLEAWPVYIVFAHRLYELPLSASAQAGIAASLALALALAIAVFTISVRVGVRRLSALEV